MEPITIQLFSCKLTNIIVLYNRFTFAQYTVANNTLSNTVTGTVRMCVHAILNSNCFGLVWLIDWYCLAIVHDYSYEIMGIVEPIYNGPFNESLMSVSITTKQQGHNQTASAQTNL